jgi:hypothetical protein
VCLFPSLFLSLAMSVACVSSSPTAPVTGSSLDSGTFDATVEVDGGSGDASAPTDDVQVSPATCFAEAGLPDGECTDLQELGASVTGTCPTGAQPAGAGGTVVDGTYVLTAQARYIDGGCVSETFQATMTVFGTCSSRVDGLSGGTTLITRDSTFETSGNVLTRTATCGASLPAATYTATATQITIFDQGGSVTTWTKQ